MSKAVDDILAFLRDECLSDEEQAELIQRLFDGEGDTHKPAGQWVMNVVDGPVVQKRSAEDTTAAIEWIHGTHVDPADGLVLTFYHGQMDGKPVIQIDGEADFRINVNDCPIWDQHTDQDYTMPDELRESFESRNRMVAKLPERKEVKCGTCGGPHHSSYCEDDK